MSFCITGIPFRDEEVVLAETRDGLVNDALQANVEVGAIEKVLGAGCILPDLRNVRRSGVPNNVCHASPAGGVLPNDGEGGARWVGEGD